MSVADHASDACPSVALSSERPFCDAGHDISAGWNIPPRIFLNLSGSLGRAPVSRRCHSTPSRMIVRIPAFPPRPQPASPADSDRPAVSKHNGSDQPCLCLCFGFSQITRITPLRFTTLHFSHMGLTDALTFTMYAPFLCCQMVTTHPRAHSYPMCSFQTPLQYITRNFYDQELFSVFFVTVIADFGSIGAKKSCPVRVTAAFREQGYGVEAEITLCFFDSKIKNCTGMFSRFASGRRCRQIFALIHGPRTGPDQTLLYLSLQMIRPLVRS